MSRTKQLYINTTKEKKASKSIQDEFSIEKEFDDYVEEIIKIFEKYLDG